MSNERGARHSARSALRSQLIAHGLPLLICALIGIASVQPFFASSSPTGADALLHFYRIAAWDELWSNGIVWSRWLPNFVFGYGYPLMNYHPPLAYVLAALVHRAGFALLPAMQITWGATAVVAAYGMYGWVTAVSHSPRAGLIAAAAYAFAPYALFNLFTRGSYAESIGLAFAPWIFLSLQRWTQTGRWRFGLLTACAYVAVLLSHVIAALLVSLMAGVYLIACAWSNGRGTTHDTTPNPLSSPLRRIVHTGIRAALPLLAGLGLTAFFWLPAQLETGLIQIQRGTSGFADFSAHFLSLAQLLSPPIAPDPHLIGQVVPASLGWIALGLASLGAVTLFMRPGRWPTDRRVQFGLIGLATMIACGMSLSPSEVIWDRLPLLHFLQYPFRFLGVASLGLAFLAGLGFAGLESSHTKVAKAISNLTCAGLVLGMAVYAFTWQVPPPAYASGPTSKPTLAEIWDTERRLGTIGTTSFGEYLPRAVAQIPDQPAFDPATVTNRIDASTLPSGTRITSAQFEPLHYRIDTQSTEAVSLTVNTFYFEGWQAYADQQPIPLHATAPAGLMQLALPAGAHTVEIRFEGTFVRRMAELISAVTVVLVLGSSVWQLSRRSRATSTVTPQRVATVPLHLGLGLTLIVGLAGIIALKTGYVDGTDNAFRHSRLSGDALSGVTHPLNINYGNKLRLIGLDAPTPQVAAGQEIEFVLFWKVIEQTGTDFSISTKVFDANGVEYGHTDSLHPNQMFPTSRAATTDYLLDTRRIRIDEATPPGQYVIKTSVYVYGQPLNLLPALEPGGGPLKGDYGATLAEVLTIRVTRPITPADPARLDIPHRTDATLGDQVQLIGHTLPPSLTLHTGDSFGLETYWQAQGTPATDSEICFTLQKPAVETTLRCALPVPALPSRDWRAGDMWRAGHAMRIPPQTEAGQYTLLMTGTSGVAVPLGQMAVTAPTRTFALPAGITLEAHPFSNGAALAGYLATPVVQAGQPFTVTLFWRTEAVLDARLKVFVQLVDAQNNRITGNDQIPGADGMERPTTDWVTGEFIADAHQFEVPADLAAGRYWLLIGLYDEGTLQRVRLNDGRDSALLSSSLEVAGP